MKVAVYNRHWATAGGGERFAGGIAEVLAEDHEVTLVAHDPFDPAELGERLQLDLGRTTVRVVGPAPEAVTAASAQVDLFVNASYASDDRAAAAHNLYVVHFPALPPFDPPRARRLAISVSARLARLAHVDPRPVQVRDGAYLAEQIGPWPARWTDGEARLLVPGGGRVLVVLGRFHPAEAGELDVVLARADGRELAGTRLRPRRGRQDPPLHPLRARLGAEEGPVELVVRSSTFRPADAGAADGRTLGAPIVAALAGPWPALPFQALHQLLAVPAASSAFLADYQGVVANSVFTQGWVRRLWGRESGVLHPPVTAQPRVAKEPVLLGVGRFFDPAAGHNKRQVELVRAFRQLRATGRAEGWELHLVGGCDRLGEPYLARVRAEAKGLPVHVHANASGATVRGLYGKASVFWHLTGLGEDPDDHPERFEHFGITTVEAMSAGVVPVVLGQAGQLELFEDGQAGFHVAGIEDLVSRSLELIASPARRERMADAAVQRAQAFLRPAFAHRLRALVAELVSSPASPHAGVVEG
ncbi:MAG: glycosyltransferase [Acidimicrobiia bacterium]|nr:glycosyltransferase [Acidimicrobiia bacterium]